MSAQRRERTPELALPIYFAGRGLGPANQSDFIEGKYLWSASVTVRRRAIPPRIKASSVMASVQPHRRNAQLTTEFLFQPKKVTPKYVTIKWQIMEVQILKMCNNSKT
jgi:hypothetical protein